MADTFRGDNAHLCECIDALLSLDASGSMAPHGVGGHARALLESAATRLRALSPAGGGERGCDWYEDEDTGSRIVDFDFVSDHSRQLSLILKANGEVAYAAYINGTRMNGADAMTPEFYSAIRMLAASPQQEPGAEGLRDAISASLYELSLVGEGREHDEAVVHIEKRITGGQTIAGAGGALMKCVCGDPKDGGGCTNRCDRGQIPPIPAETYRVTDGKLQKATATSAGTTGDSEDAARYRLLRDSVWDNDLHEIITMHKNKLWDAAIDARRAREVG